MKCIGYWKENLKSYLITYDELDAFSRYRCWVYQREDLNRIRMSLALGPYCSLKQDVTSWNYTEGAAVSLTMEEYERERTYFQKLTYFENAICEFFTNAIFRLTRWPMSYEFWWWFESIQGGRRKSHHVLQRSGRRIVTNIALLHVDFYSATCLHCKSTLKWQWWCQ